VSLLWLSLHEYFASEGLPASVWEVDDAKAAPVRRFSPRATPVEKVMKRVMVLRFTALPSKCRTPAPCRCRRTGRVGLATHSPDGLGDRFVSVRPRASVGAVRINASLPARSPGSALPVSDDHARWLSEKI
jgi:hypothetical protein